MDPILEDIIKPIKSGTSYKWIVGIALFGLSFYFASIKKDVEELTLQLKQCAEFRQAAEDSVKVLTESIMRQNEAILENNQKFIELNNRRDNLTNTLLHQQKVSNNIVKQILNDKPPETCEQAREYLIKAGKELVWLK